MYAKFIHAAAAVALLASAGVARSQVPPPQNPTQFDVTGVIQAATLDPTCTADRLCGGTITVNNQVITVPRNTILQMPAAALTWQDVFFLAPPPYGIPGGPGVTTTVPSTGLAMSDLPAPLVKYEAHVVGNRVVDATTGLDRHIAGLVFLSQRSLQSAQGFINYIDYATGEFRVGGTSPTTGQRVKINDPAGRFGRAWSPDVRFTIDENNPTIRAATGFPMCIPRSNPATADDPLCPQRNRRDPATGTIFAQLTYPAVGAPGTTAVSLTGPDARLMAPFEVGDYVSYSGILLNDAANLPYIAAYQVIGNVGLFTWPGDALAYIATDVMILGVGGITTAGATEATIRTRFEGWTTDPARNIRLYGIDVDPCSGAQTLRDWGSIDADPGPPTGAALGRWRFRPPSKVLSMPAAGVFLPATREMRSVVEIPATSTTPAGMLAAYPDPNNPALTLPGSGFYQAPIFEFLFPENAGTGKPIVPNNFEDMPFLAQGSGPLDGTAGNPIVGQLNPWPLGFQAPVAAPLCNALPPIANAGPAQSVAANALVTLDGTGSTDPNNPAQLPLTYAWTQTGGTAVVLSSPTAAKPTFTAPAISAGTSATLTFSLVVQNSVPLASTNLATVTITVTGDPIANAGVAQTVVVGQTVTLNGTASLNAAKALWTLVSASPALPSGTTINLQNANSLTATFVAPTTITQQTVLTFNLQVTNGAGVSANAQVAVTVTPTPPKPVASIGVIAGGNTSAYGSNVSFTVPANTGVILDGSKSTPTFGLTYAWKQTSGTVVALSNAATSKASFTTPNLAIGAANATLKFQLQVTNSSGSNTANVTITVTAPKPPLDTVTIALAQYRLQGGKQRLTVDANSSAQPPNTPSPTLSMQAFDSTGKATTKVVNMTWNTTLVPPAYEVVVVGTVLPAKVVVTSSFGGSATTTNITTK